MRAQQVGERLNGIFEHVLRPHKSKCSDKHIEINIHLKTGRSLHMKLVNTRRGQGRSSLTMSDIDQDIIQDAETAAGPVSELRVLGSWPRLS